YIGVDVSGNGTLGNTGTGISLSASQNQGAAQGPSVIGGATSSPGTGVGNVISGNVGDGILFGIPSGGVLGPVTIQGNIIGLGVDGTTAIGNGIGIESQTSGTSFGALLIGGTASGAGNLISGNHAGGISTRFANGIIQGNRIGIQADGTSPLGNGGAGITVLNFGLPVQILVGGIAAGAGNVIAFNAGSGVS